MASSSDSKSDMEKGTASDVDMKQSIPCDPAEDEPQDMVIDNEEEYTSVRTGIAKAFPKPAAGIRGPPVGELKVFVDGQVTLPLEALPKSAQSFMTSGLEEVIQENKVERSILRCEAAANMPPLQRHTLGQLCMFQGTSNFL